MKPHMTVTLFAAPSLLRLMCCNINMDCQRTQGNNDRWTQHTRWHAANAQTAPTPFLLFYVHEQTTLSWLDAEPRQQVEWFYLKFQMNMFSLITLFLSYCLRVQDFLIRNTEIWWIYVVYMNHVFYIKSINTIYRICVCVFGLNVFKDDATTIGFVLYFHKRFISQLNCFLYYAGNDCLCLCKSKVTYYSDLCFSSCTQVEPLRVVKTYRKLHIKPFVCCQHVTSQQADFQNLVFW